MSKRPLIIVDSSTFSPVFSPLSASLWCQPRPESLRQHLWNAQWLSCESAGPFHGCLQPITASTVPWS